MLSICIPTYNYDIRNLIKTLVNQIEEINVPIEILVFDDQSKIQYQQINQEIDSFSIVNYTILEKNIGHSKIRNLFTKHAKYDHLLYMDADTIPIKNDFVKKYLNAIQKNALIYGGLDYLKKKPVKSHLLRWKYGHAREVIPIEIRKKKPYNIFISMSFLIPKQLLLQFPFDEKITQYGHEDRLLAYRLKQNNIPLIHIDNPVYHLNLDSSKAFLKKTEKAVESLVFVRTQNSKDFNQMVRLLAFASKIQKMKLSWLVKLTFFISKPFIKWNLFSSFPIIYFLDLYKLGYLINVASKNDIDL